MVKIFYLSHSSLGFCALLDSFFHVICVHIPFFGLVIDTYTLFLLHRVLNKVWFVIYCLTYTRWGFFKQLSAHLCYTHLLTLICSDFSTIWLLCQVLIGITTDGPSQCLFPSFEPDANWYSSDWQGTLLSSSL